MSTIDNAESRNLASATEYAESRNLVTTFFTIPVGDGRAEPGPPPHRAAVPRGDAAVVGLQWRVGAVST